MMLYLALGNIGFAIGKGRRQPFKAKFYRIGPSWIGFYLTGKTLHILRGISLG